MDAPFGSWGTQTFIAGLSADALIAPWVIKGAMDGEAFTAYVEQVLVPELEPGTVVILDNLATYRNAAAAKAMHKAGCWLLFLPPYSLDLNPIEMAFSKLKTHLRRIGARTFNDMFHALTEICGLFSPEECWNCFKAAGHVSGKKSDALEPQKIAFPFRALSGLDTQLVCGGAPEGNNLEPSKLPSFFQND